MDDTTEVCEEDLILLHRADCFEELGYDEQDALILASMPWADHHRFAALIKDGCSRELAVEILS